MIPILLSGIQVIACETIFEINSSITNFNSKKNSKFYEILVNGTSKESQQEHRYRFHLLSRNKKKAYYPYSHYS